MDEDLFQNGQHYRVYYRASTANNPALFEGYGNVLVSERTSDQGRALPWTIVCRGIPPPPPRPRYTHPGKRPRYAHPGKRPRYTRSGKNLRASAG